MPYTRQQLEDALDAVRVNGSPLPAAFENLGRNYARTARQWAELSLEERVSRAACLLGPRNAPESDRLISAAYRDLCAKGALDLAEPALELGPLPALR